MKKRVKLGLGGLLLLMGVTVLSGCTASFCSSEDKAHLLYAFDFGVTEYADSSDTTDRAYYLTKVGDSYQKVELPQLTYKVDIEYCSTVLKIQEAAVKEGISIPSDHYWETMDALFLGEALETARASKNKLDFTVPADADIKSADLRRDYKDEEARFGILDVFGFTKYYDASVEGNTTWGAFEARNAVARSILKEEGYVDDAANIDFIKLYKSKMNGYISGYRSCLATTTDYYGSYGPHNIPVEIQAKKWTDWKGLLEFLFVWPIGAFIDVLTKGFLNMGTANGWSQVLAIFVVTIVIRSIMLLVTFRQTKSNAKMTELQPEITKIQQKYPNANTNRYEKQRMAEEMSRLYKKHGVKPLASLLVMVVQFPIFICVWGAMQGSAYLSSGSFLGLRLSDSISSKVFSPSAWANGGGATALILFLLMSIAQAVAMLLPQFIQKKKAKEVAKLGRNPSQKSQNNRMKFFTYAMLAMIIFMGFSLASGMGVYWFVGALFSIAQTLITQHHAKKTQKKGK